MSLDLRFACLLGQRLSSQNQYEEVFSDSPQCYTATSETLNLNNSSNFLKSKWDASGAQSELIDEKNQRSKFHDTVYLIKVITLNVLHDPRNNFCNCSGPWSQDRDVVLVRRTIDLGCWEFGMGRERGGGGQFTSNLGTRWTGSHHAKGGIPSK